ncbi:conserved hypothetical protein [Leishmania mexicana MHOM/GT/2001/U1103]|uniref:Uncharacterized protein n=1 Tax=Leishmania mexicana (strain MHOM/GT/2001/U1103) TaxID=929439 RepID=E9B1N2_LEIMU|nr:conserved hypothetical protein [Leishmania mexicana MHOM/GT/2001/U1103]CBZ29138.1 conserved hypothetical protein [Leishmania mexicana MHOM/GT/2001/U1103]
MPAREENEDFLAFARATSDSVHLSRDNSAQGRAAREPISTRGQLEEEVFTAPQRSFDGANTGRRDSIDDMMLRITIPDSRSIQNLPVFNAPELKLIGRCVSFCVKMPANDATSVTYYYTGLVAMVTGTSVALIYVNRYTREAFDAYKTLEQYLESNQGPAPDEQSLVKSAPLRIHKAMRTLRTLHTIPTTANVETSTAQPSQSVFDGLLVHPNSKEGEAGADDDSALSIAVDPYVLCAADAAGSLAPAVPLKIVAELQAAEERDGDGEERVSGEARLLLAEGASGAGAVNRGLRVRNFRRFSGSIGLIPYMTFLRKSIENVEFGRDPNAIFYSLFQDPAKHIDDMQCLRMFVRRYLVHTSEGNNPHQVPLYAFLCVRCAWPDVDRELVNRLVHEELTALVKADCAIAKEKERKRVREERQLQRYRAPAGLFSSTGILFLTKIPQGTFLAAVVILVFTMIFAMFLSVTLSTMSDALIVTFLNKLIRSFLISIIVWGITGITTVVYATVVHLPLSECTILVVIHIFFAVFSAVCCILCLAVILSNMAKSVIYRHMVDHQSFELCDFYQRHNCTGFMQSCKIMDSYNVHLCNTCPPLAVDNGGCYFVARRLINVALVPMLVFTIFITITLVYIGFLLFRLLMAAKAMIGRFF